MKPPVCNSETEARFRRPSASGGLWFKLYDAAFYPGTLLAFGASPFHGRLREALSGRRGGVKGWRIGAPDERPLLLIHAASAGEYEGARPLIERLLEWGGCRMAVSFSSPSVRKAVGNTEGLWAQGFLPMDYLYQQVALIGRLEPRLIVILKHDFWPNMLRAAQELKVPVVLANANFHPRSRRELPLVRSFHRSFMRWLRAVWTVSEDDAHRASRLLSPGTGLEVVGDTRYDRVRQRAARGAERFRALKEALAPGPVIVAGSTWLPGERICWTAFAALKCDHPSLKMVVVPHEPTAVALRRNRDLAERLGLAVKLMSQWQSGQVAEEILLVDSLGVLAEIYAVGWSAYVGGGFGRGVHSVLEPAGHALPVAFGPRHHVSHEAGLLLKEGGGFVVRNPDDLERLWRGWLSDPDAHRRAAAAADRVVRSREGATGELFRRITALL